jgi:hypothetical protein
MTARAEVDFDVLEELGMRGMGVQQMSGELGIARQTLSKIMTNLKDKQGILLKYRELQPLQLTAIQARILEHITPEKIQEAPLRDLVLAFKILKDKELTMDGKPSEIKGLVGYLIELEKAESKAEVEEFTDAEFSEASEAASAASATFVSSSDEDLANPDYLPKLN